MNPTTDKSAAERGRWAVAAFFFTNGFLVGSWAPQIPVFLTRLQITEFTLGLLIVGFGIGALVAMPWCGWLIHRYGSRAALRGFAIVCAFGLLGIALVPNVWVAAIMLVLFGGLVGGMDVAMNSNAVAVEGRLRRAVMSSSHGFWSLGGFAGGASGSLAIQHFGHLNHAIFATVIAVVLVLVASRYLITNQKPVTDKPTKFGFPRIPAIYLTGIVALFSMVPEGAVLDWAAIYIRQEFGSEIAVAGFAFAAFSATMAIMRFAGDGVRTRFGAVATMRVSSLVAASGMLLAGVAPTDWTAIAAFALCGFGIANMVPIAFSAAGNHREDLSGAGLSTVTAMGYSGSLAAPSVIGFIGEHTGFAPIFIALAVLLCVVFLMAGLARAADFEAGQPAE
ncbi:MAG: MFS transporter [Rhizobiaceae bacterium]|nr:MFS transporter [Rhizobiaceae bacterium]